LTFTGLASSLPMIQRSFVPVAGRGSCVFTAPTPSRGCLGVNAFHARGAALSPDGKFLYSFGGFDASSTVRVFSRSSRTGLLAPVRGRDGCVRLYWAAVKCTPMPVNKPTALAISPDGRDVFVTGYCCADSFAAFRRDPRT